MPSQPSSAPSPLAPVKFGTDGWRGIIAAEFTFERLVGVVPVAAQVLESTYGKTAAQRLIIVGYDRRFLSENFAQATAEAVSQAGFDVLLADDYAPTPALSWAVQQYGALGALVITASHNPGIYSGLKIKGAFGGSVPAAVTQKVQDCLVGPQPLPVSTTPGKLERFNPWSGYCGKLQSMVDLDQINQAINQGNLSVFVDPMHGATAGGLGQILAAPIHELNSDRDPLFEGGAPEPLPRFLTQVINAIQSYPSENGVTVGLVFDGDGDRIAAIDGQGNYLSSQILIPILIDHLASRRGMKGEVIKTISGSNLIPKVAALHHLPVYETSIGYKYIAARMLSTDRVLLGGEESGGIGYGHYIPERDGLMSALYLLEAIAQSGQDLSDLHQQLRTKTAYDFVYDRIDLPLGGDAAKSRLMNQLETQPFTEILGQQVTGVGTGDGFKFQLADHSWLLIRFSGTEPVLRLYCEAHSPEQVQRILEWAKTWALN